eukprot:2007997-Rhodomonas_salina.1
MWDAYAKPTLLLLALAQRVEARPGLWFPHIRCQYQTPHLLADASTHIAHDCVSHICPNSLCQYQAPHTALRCEHQYHEPHTAHYPPIANCPPKRVSVPGIA